MTYKLSKLGQTNLVLNFRSDFISRSVHAGLQVSQLIYSILVNRQTHRQMAFDRLYY